MILNQYGEPVSSSPQSESRRGIHTDVYCLPKGASAPKKEYFKLLKILERGDIREKLASSEKMPERKGMHNIYLDTHCGLVNESKKKIAKTLQKHQDAFSKLVEKRANDEKITETQKAYENAK